MRELWVVLGTTMADRHPRTALRAVFARFDPSRTTGPNLASVLTTQRQKICRGFYGSEGTRTRGLRRDRGGMRRSLSDPADPLSAGKAVIARNERALPSSRTLRPWLSEDRE